MKVEWLKGDLKGKTAIIDALHAKGLIEQEIVREVKTRKKKKVEEW